MCQVTLNGDSLISIVGFFLLCGVKVLLVALLIFCCVLEIGCLLVACM